MIQTLVRREKVDELRTRHRRRVSTPAGCIIRARVVRGEGAPRGSTARSPRSVWMDEEQATEGAGGIHAESTYASRALPTRNLHPVSSPDTAGDNRPGDGKSGWRNV